MHERARSRLVAELTEGSRRAARRVDCPKCGDPCIKGDDHDEVAYVATVDAEPLDPVGEFLAILRGRATFDLARMHDKNSPTGSHALYYREPWHVHSVKPPPGTVHALHRCDPQIRRTLF